MPIVQRGVLRGAFNGFQNSSTVFEFLDGSTWQQAEEKSCSYPTYMPHARVLLKQGMHFLEIDGMKETVRIVRKNRSGDSP